MPLSKLNSSELTTINPLYNLSEEPAAKLKHLMDSTRHILNKTYRNNDGVKKAIFELPPELLQHITLTLFNPTVRETLMPDPTTGYNFKATPALSNEGKQFGTYFSIENRLFLINKITNIGSGCMKDGGVHIGIDLDRGTVVTFSESKFTNVENDVRIEKKLTEASRKNGSKLIKFLFKPSYLDQDDNKIQILISKYRNRGDLEIFATEIPKLTFLEKLKLVRDILEGLEDMHSQKIIHRDIKPANIFINKVSKVKISDASKGSYASSAASSSNTHDLANIPNSGPALSVPENTHKVKKKYSAKIGDYGLAFPHKNKKQRTFPAGSSLYAAPELFKLLKRFNRHQDIRFNHGVNYSAFNTNLEPNKKMSKYAQMLLRKEKNKIKKSKNKLFKFSKKNITEKIDIYSLGQTLENIFLKNMKTLNTFSNPSSENEIGYWTSLIDLMKTSEHIHRPTASRLLQIINLKIEQIK